MASAQQMTTRRDQQRSSSTYSEYYTNLLGANHDARSTYDTFITVLVGENKKSFLVHQDLICDRSPFFKAACSSAWPANSGAVQLPNHQPFVFQAYLQWAYSASHDLSSVMHEIVEDQADYKNDTPLFQSRVRCSALTMLWILADYLQDSACKNNVMKNLDREQSTNKGLHHNLHGLFETVYTKTVQGSGLRRWLVDTVLPTVTKDYLTVEASNLPADMLVDLFKAFVGRKGQCVHETYAVSQYYE